jgi:chitinase
MPTKSIFFSLFFLLISNFVLAQNNTYTPCPKRIVAYFPFWADQPHKGNYGVEDIPWAKLTHINYAFAAVGNDFRIELLDTAIQIQNVYPNQDNALPYKGQFNQITHFKQQFPNVKVLISIGGWAESGGFWAMAADSAHTELFAASCVQFLRDYSFDGIDIDWEFPTASEGVTHPENHVRYYNQYKTVVYSNYMRLLRILKLRITQAKQQDQKEYLLTAAGAASGWTLGGMELAQFTQHLDMLNIMSYDLHGAWNQYVGHQSSLYASTADNETAQLDQPYLNIDWAVKYYSGAIHPSKINIGIPYYSRGWTQVSGGTNGLWGTSPTANHTWTYNVNGQNQTYTQTMGVGAGGIDGIWNDPAPEPDAGANPLWHVMNLLKNPNTANYPYLATLPVGAQHTNVTGYTRFFDNTTKNVYVWNATKQVFLTYEDTASLRHKLQYIMDRGVGGMMFWELSGDYHYNNATAQYETGSDMTNYAHDFFQAHQNTMTPIRVLPTAVNTFKYSFTGAYSHPNFTPDFKIINTGTTDIAGGWVLEFDMPKSCRWESTWGTGAISLIDATHPLYNRLRIDGPTWMNIPAGGNISISGAIKLPFGGGPLNVVLNGKSSTFERLLSANDCLNTATDDISTENTLKTYPNPTNGSFIVEIPAQAINLSVFDAMGRVVFTKKPIIGQNTIELPNNLPNACYFVRVEAANSIAIARIMVIR